MSKVALELTFAKYLLKTAIKGVICETILVQLLDHIEGIDRDALNKMLHDLSKVHVADVLMKDDATVSDQIASQAGQEAIEELIELLGN